MIPTTSKHEVIEVQLSNDWPGSQIYIYIHTLKFYLGEVLQITRGKLADDTWIVGQRGVDSWVTKRG